MEKKFTRGQWHPVEYAGFIHIQKGPYYGDLDILNCDKVGEIEAEANGKLIAAAPDLLEACLEFVRKVEAGEARSTKSYAQMKEAIKKALD